MAGSLLAAPLAAEAQPAGEVWRIGLLAAGRPPANLAIKGPFHQGLDDLIRRGAQRRDRIPICRGEARAEMVR